MLAKMSACKDPNCNGTIEDYGDGLRCIICKGLPFTEILLPNMIEKIEAIQRQLEFLETENNYREAENLNLKNHLYNAEVCKEELLAERIVEVKLGPPISNAEGVLYRLTEKGVMETYSMDTWSPAVGSLDSCFKDIICGNKTYIRTLTKEDFLQIVLELAPPL